MDAPVVAPVSPIPPISLSSGPAISGGQNESGAGVTGSFIINKAPRWTEQLATIGPILLVGGLLWFFTHKK